MNKLSFPYVEDYIGFLAGGSQFNRITITLARYDVSIVQNLYMQSINGLAFTDKQGALAVKLVTKYKRQFEKNNICISSLESLPVFKHPLRQIDRTKKSFIDQGKIKVIFPFDPVLISQLRKINETHAQYGRMVFNYDEKYWHVPLIEPIILELYPLLLKNNFTIDTELQLIIDKIIKIKETNFKISLEIDENNVPYIVNATDSLLGHISSKCGGFDKENILKLADLSSLYGYSVSDSVAEYIASKYENINIDLIVNREYSDKNLSQAVAYAKLTNRFPVYLYGANPTGLKEQLYEFFSPTEISNAANIPGDNIKCILINKINPNITSIPLLITTEAMLVGIKRQHIKQLSEKIFFYTNTVFHKLNT